MKPEDLIGPAAAKALAEHFDLTPKAKPLPEVVTPEEVRAAWEHYLESRPGMPANDQLGIVLEAFVLRWLRSRLEECTHNPRCLVKDGGNASIFKALTGREWKP